MKPWFESKTVWFNIIMTFLGVVPIALAFLKVMYPDAVVLIDAVLATVAGIGNVILRVWFTDTPIGSLSDRLG